VVNLCGRYTLLTNKQKIKEHFMIQNDWDVYEPSYNIAPSQPVLVVIYDGKINRAGYIQWGLVPFWAKDKKLGPSLMNARVETMHVKPSFKQLVTRRRCLIIADSFYEWKQTDKGKVPQRIQQVDKGLFAFAGLWDKWESDTEELYSCTMLTKDANDFMKDIHHRMPIMLNQADSMKWLQTSFSTNEAAQGFISHTTDPSLTSYPVTTYVNNARNSNDQCIVKSDDV